MLPIFTPVSLGEYLGLSVSFYLHSWCIPDPMLQSLAYLLHCCTGVGGFLNAVAEGERRIQHPSLGSRRDRTKLAGSFADRHTARSLAAPTSKINAGTAEATSAVCGNEGNEVQAFGVEKRGVWRFSDTPGGKHIAVFEEGDHNVTYFFSLDLTSNNFYNFH